MKKILPLIILIFAAKTFQAQVTWSNKVAGIIYSNCSNCHNSNGIAPFTLMNYNDAIQNGFEIQEEVENKTMPPWPPDPSYSHLAHERILTSDQISDISAWVDNGMPRGDSTLEPATPVFNNISEISSPDLILNAPTYPVNTTTDDYHCFVIPSNLLTDKYLTAFEAVPGDRSVVHHILIYSDSTDVPAQLDAQTPEIGYTNFGGTGSSSSKLIGVWVPGMRAYFSPAGMGIRLEAHTNIVVQIHYPGGISGKTDQTKLFLKLTSNFKREIYIDSPLNHFQLDNGFLYIPANTTKTFTAHYKVPADMSVLAVGPHMHLIGKSIMSYCVTPSHDTIPFIDIPNWDFHWQGNYSFPKVLKIPNGSTLYSSAFYDNTANNPENPNHPPKAVFLGEKTTDEMMLVYFAFLPYQDGDENIIIDSTGINSGIIPVTNSIITTLQLYEPTPNPAGENINYEYYLPKSMSVKISVFDIEGKLVREENPGTVSQGLVSTHMNIAELSAGIYFLKLEANYVVRTKKFVKE